MAQLEQKSSDEALAIKNEVLNRVGKSKVTHFGKAKYVYTIMF
jgi:hypothetical protein